MDWSERDLGFSFYFGSWESLLNELANKELVSRYYYLHCAFAREYSVQTARVQNGESAKGVFSHCLHSPPYLIRSTYYLPVVARKFALILSLELYYEQWLHNKMMIIMKK